MNAIVSGALWFQINLNELLFFCVLYFLCVTSSPRCIVMANMTKKNLETKIKTETLI